VAGLHISGIGKEESPARTGVPGVLGEGSKPGGRFFQLAPLGSKEVFYPFPGPWQANGPDDRDEDNEQKYGDEDFVHFFNGTDAFPDCQCTEEDCH